MELDLDDHSREFDCCPADDFPAAGGRILFGENGRACEVASGVGATHRSRVLECALFAGYLCGRDVSLGMLCGFTLCFRLRLRICFGRPAA
jgi:hypothetical protein